MPIDLNDAGPQQCEAEFEMADSFTVDICEHGFGMLALWKDGANHPFAVAQFGPSAIAEIAAVFAQAMQVEGHA
jgi:hypothetical protein